MDSKLIYDPKKISCSKIIQIGRTIDHFYKALLDKRPLDNTKKKKGESQNSALNKNIVACLKKYDKYVSEDQFKNVEERCNLDLLKSPTDMEVLNVPTWKTRKLYTTQDPLAGTDLETLESLRQFKLKIERSKVNINLTMERYLKYRSNIMIEPVKQHDAIRAKDGKSNSVITIRTYHPFRHDIGKINGKHHPRFDREFKVLGSTLLKEFRNAFICRQDSDTGKEKSKNLTESTVPDDLGMGFFYINGILYIDDTYSYEESHKYAEQLEKWGIKKHFDIRIHDMSNICFEDIYVRLGYPNVYQHRGCCEHIFVLTDAECISNQLALITYQYKYPLVSLIHGDCQTYCSICSKFVASWITVNNPRSVDTETLMCQTCFVTYNYTEHDEKIGTFQAYRYFSL